MGGDDVAKEFASRALPLAQVDANTQISTELMAKAESSMTTLITTAKAHSFYRGNDDGAPEVEDAESAFHELVNSGGDQKKALAAMKVAEAIKQAREVKGKNITKAEVQEAMKASTGNFKNLLRGLGIQGKDAGKKCPNKCLQACTGGDHAQQLSCSNTMERMAEKSGANKVPPAIKKMVDALEAKRAAQ